MHLLPFLVVALVVVAVEGGKSASPTCAPFPSSMIEFSANFKQPQPPLVKPHFQASFIQHKWDQNLSHITTGYIENSPSKTFVRVVQAYNGKMASSFFNFANVTEEGLVDNTLTTFDAGSTTPDVWRGYVNSNFPLFSAKILIDAGAVFGGLVKRDFVDTPVATWNIMYQGVIPVSVFVDNCNIVVGFDYFAPELRTRVITKFFNIRA
ncbi:hypothetical protein B0J13DRAFT_108154 [Dactylonectria estremocensis]|uniref:Uncharacterized protein n=1 Tax=Dactylonectria estremocensis TaxID=1079267 RepID=A0A9P9ISK0_9HYPO|nr:hypothetical protein B0J13DRAFT_108154 [Dactylonectria estremocensis]